MIGVTIGVGEQWAALAESSARAMEEMTGVRCHVLRADAFGCCHPSWLKCHVHRIFPQEDAFLVFDADLLCVRQWDPRNLFKTMARPFMGVPEPNANDEVLEECREWGLGFPDFYLNCGLLIFGREHGFVLDRAWSLHPHGGRWLEQTAINHALALEAVETCRLPRVFNVLAQEGRINAIYCRATLKDAVNVHFCAMKSAEQVSASHAKLRAYMATGNYGRTRKALLWDLRTRVGVQSQGAEIGVFAGEFSREILSILQPKALHLVDLFEGIATSGNVNGQAMKDVDLGIVRQELDAIGAPVKTWAADSVEWLQGQFYPQLDWVYLDTTHEYERTRAELEAARKVVKPGGIIAGHDMSRAFPGVVRAVTEFVAQHGLTLKIYDGDLLPSFWIENSNSTRQIAE